MKRAPWSIALLASLAALPAFADNDPSEARSKAVSQLRDAVGTWNVVTEFIAPDGTVTQRADGTYEFDWVVPDRVLIGTSRIPSMDMAAGLLFYIDEAADEIEMVSVAGDGRLWVMSGPVGSETRYSEPYATADGGEAQLRFTRYAAEPDRFESKMEYTTDGGQTWIQGNRQVFVRASGSDEAAGRSGSAKVPAAEPKRVEPAGDDQTDATTEPAAPEAGTDEADFEDAETENTESADAETKDAGTDINDAETATSSSPDTEAAADDASSADGTEPSAATVAPGATEETGELATAVEGPVEASTGENPEAATVDAPE